MECLVINDYGDKHGYPKDYGLVDWHHDKDGKVSYPWYKPKERTRPVDISSIESRELQRWSEDCTEEAMDNLDYGRNTYAARCEFFKQWERNEQEYN